jgi:hypothetical protein
MNHNPHKLKKGQRVALDADFTNSSEVVIDGFTPNEMFATVYDAKRTGADPWRVMTLRLSPLANSKSEKDKL